MHSAAIATAIVVKVKMDRFREDQIDFLVGVELVITAAVVVPAKVVAVELVATTQVLLE